MPGDAFCEQQRNLAPVPLAVGICSVLLYGGVLDSDVYIRLNCGPLPKPGTRQAMLKAAENLKHLYKPFYLFRMANHTTEAI